MSLSKDLTRWNRASLTRFRYVDGNAVEYLEMLRQQLVQQFADSETKLCTWLTPAEEIPANEETADNETLIQRQQRQGRRRERILASYNQDRRDWGWEISRTFARACHILTEHTNAYANEGYLGTATQWDNVRRLVEMLDYHPAPPASASTKLVLEAKESKSGLVKKGWKVKYKPPEGGDKVVFETLDDIQVHFGLNGLRVDGFDTSPDLMGEVGEDGSITLRWVTEENDGIEDLELSSGNAAILLNPENDQAIVVTVGEINNATNSITLTGISAEEKAWLDGTLPVGAKPWTKGVTQLFIEPDDIRKFRLNGSGVVRFKDAHGLDDGDVIVWHDDSTSMWQYNRVVESDGILTRLVPSSPLPGDGTDIFKLYRIDKGSDSIIKFPLDTLWKTAVTWDGLAGRYSDLIDGDDYVSRAEPISSPENTHNEITNGEINEIFLFYTDSPEAAIGIVEAKEPSEYTIDGVPGDLASGQWIIAEDGTGDLLALQISAITEYEAFFVITFEDPPEASGGTIRAEPVVESLKKEIRKLQPSLDEWAMAEVTLSEFISGDVANRDALCIQGIGTYYFDLLRGDDTEFTLGQLAEILPASLDVDISRVRLNEFKTNAERVLSFQCEAVTFEQLSGNTLTELLEGSPEEFAELINTDNGQNSLPADVGALRRLYGAFEHTLYPLGHNRNNDGILSEDEYLVLAANTSKDALALLKLGHRLILEREDGSGDPVSIEVKQVTIEDESGEKRLYLSRKLKEDEVFTKGNLIIRGNVILAGHGEGKPVKILGSGDAAKSNQEFTLDVAEVSFTPDATKSFGVAAAIEVNVAGRVWEQVSTLKDSSPGDHHYAIRMTEESYVKIIFGDGEYGRRLPSGKNNIRIRFRVGSGIAGNVPVGGLEKPVNPHPMIVNVRQPLPAAGGGDMEDIASLRENAPPTLLALERAVSLADFSHLAASQSSVWQAKAYSQILHGGRTESVKVVIVPADGVLSIEIDEAIQSFLQRHALPAVQVSVESFGEVHFSLSTTVRVNTDEFIAEEVEKAVALALSDHFTLKNRKLGEHLYLSEVYKVVERVQGVENSICVLNADKSMQVFEAEDVTKVVYLDTDADNDPSTLEVIAEEYRP